MNRASFIQTSGRIGIFALVALVVGILLKNNQITTTPTTDKCQTCKLNPESCNKTNCPPKPDPGLQSPSPPVPQSPITSHQSPVTSHQSPNNNELP